MQVHAGSHPQVLASQTHATTCRKVPAHQHHLHTSMQTCATLAHICHFVQAFCAHILCTQNKLSHLCTCANTFGWACPHHMYLHMCRWFWIWVNSKPSADTCTPVHTSTSAQICAHICTLCKHKKLAQMHISADYVFSCCMYLQPVATGKCIFAHMKLWQIAAHVTKRYPHLFVLFSPKICEKVPAHTFSHILDLHICTSCKHTRYLHTLQSAISGHNLWPIPRFSLVIGIGHIHRRWILLWGLALRVNEVNDRSQGLRPWLQV